MEKQKNYKNYILLILIQFGCLSATGISLMVGEPDMENFPEICMTISVRDTVSNQDINLDSTMVSLYEDSIQILALNLETIGERDEGVAILIAVDASLSMAGEPMDSIKAAIRQFIKEISDDDRVGIIVFHDDVQVISDFSSEKDTLHENVGKIEAIGQNTQLNRGMFKGLNMLHDDEGLPSNKVLIVLSDGKNEGTGTAYTDNDAIEKANEYNIPIYSIGYHTKSEKRYLWVLERISEKTGGRYNDAPTSKELNKIYSHVFSQIQQQTKLCYVSALSGPDSSEHTVSITVTNSDGSSATAEVKIVVPMMTVVPSETNWIYPVGIVLLIIIVSLLINNSNKKKAQEEKEKLLHEQETLRKELADAKKTKKGEKPGDDSTQVVDAGPDPRQTVISGSAVGKEYQIQFHFESGPLTGQTKPISVGMSIGRSDKNDLVIQDGTVSGQHCKIEYRGNQYMITDMNSTNGTIVNGNKVSTSELKQGDKIQLGKVQILVK